MERGHVTVVARSDIMGSGTGIPHVVIGQSAGMKRQRVRVGSPVFPSLFTPAISVSHLHQPCLPFSALSLSVPPFALPPQLPVQRPRYVPRRSWRNGQTLPAHAGLFPQRPRTYATIPDPTQPTDSPKPTDVPKPSGGGNTALLVVVGLAAAGGGYYYLSNQEDPHAQRKADEERLKEKAAELREAGKATAHDAVREGQQMYEETKVRASVLSSSCRALHTSVLMRLSPYVSRVPRISSRPHVHKLPRLCPTRATLPYVNTTMRRRPSLTQHTRSSRRLRRRTMLRRQRPRLRPRVGTSGSGAGSATARQRQMRRSVKVLRRSWRAHRRSRRRRASIHESLVSFGG